MILAIDIGNTNIVLGGYRDGQLEFTTRIATDRSLQADQYALEIAGILRLYRVESESIEGAVISSVVPSLTHALERAVRLFAPVEPVILGTDSDTGVEVCIDNPAELGADILASAVAVKERWPLPAVVIDMGTATTLTALDKNGAVQGVSIMPGVFISLDALTGRTSLLKGIALEAPARAIGKNTTDSMKSGVVFGAAAMLDGMLDRFEAELGGPAACIATGGVAELIVPCCRHTITLCDTLLLDGLYLLYLRQKNKK